MIKKAIASLYNFLIHTVFDRWISPYVIIFFIHFFPSGVNLYSVLTVFYSGSGILKKHKIKKKSNVIDEFDIYVSGFNDIKEINIIMRGKSTDFFSNDIDYNLPTFCVNFNKIDKINPNVIYITADNGYYQRMMDKIISPLILIGNGNIKSDSCNLDSSDSAVFKKNQSCLLTVNYSGYRFYIPGALNKSTGSGVLTIIGLSKIAEKINIYGWDFYMDDFVYKKSYIDLLLYFTKPIGSRKSILGYTFYKIINCNYIYRMSTDNRFHIKSFFSNLEEKHKKLFDGMGKIIYK
jgi:hypothetical protein